MATNLYRSDEALTIRLALPAAGKTVTSDPVHIAQKGAVNGAVLKLSVPALTALAADKKMALTVESSEDGETWTALSYPVLTVTGTTTTGGADAAEAVERVPLAAGPYLRLKVVADASSGDNTANSAVLAVQA